jgi:hypothetical protein
MAQNLHSKGSRCVSHTYMHLLSRTNFWTWKFVATCNVAVPTTVNGKAESNEQPQKALDPGKRVVTGRH